MPGRNLGQIQSLVLGLGSASSPCGSPSLPQMVLGSTKMGTAGLWLQDLLRSPCRLQFPKVRSGIPARFPHGDPESPIGKAPGPRLATSIPAAPPLLRELVQATRVTFWKCSSLKPWVLSPQHTDWHSPRPPFPLRSQVAGSLSPSHGRHPQTHSLRVTVHQEELPRW